MALNENRKGVDPFYCSVTSFQVESGLYSVMAAAICAVRWPRFSRRRTTGSIAVCAGNSCAILHNGALKKPGGRHMRGWTKTIFDPHRVSCPVNCIGGRTSLNASLKRLIKIDRKRKHREISSEDYLVRLLRLSGRDSVQHRTKASDRLCPFANHGKKHGHGKQSKNGIAPWCRQTVYRGVLHTMSRARPEPACLVQGADTP